MKKFLLVSIITASALGALVTATPSTAEACSPAYYSPEHILIESSPEIVVGQVLEAKALESTVQNGRAVTLYQLSVYVGETLRGTTSRDSLVTVYVVADAERTLPGAVTGAENDDAYYLAASAPPPHGDVGIYGEMPAAPMLLQNYLFFARPFGAAGELVLAQNQATHMEPVGAARIEQIREQINSYLTYGYAY